MPKERRSLVQEEVRWIGARRSEMEGGKAAGASCLTQFTGPVDTGRS